MLGNIEPMADALVAGFDTRTEAMFDAIVGTYAPSGRLPLSFPIDNAAIAVDEHGHCASPNDVPGYAKERYMDGRPYVYTDTDGNRYRLGHGLALDVCRGVESADPVDSGAELGLRRRQGQPARHDQLGQRTGVQPPT